MGLQSTLEYGKLCGVVKFPDVEGLYTITINSIKIKRALYNYSEDTQCDICGCNEETIEDIMFDCRHAIKVWRGINVNIDAVKNNCNSVTD